MNTEIPLVSIAICTYNGEKYLVQQLDSILNQDHDKLEIIVVDDGSEDSTTLILANYAAKDNRVKVYINEQNLGFNANFERAMSLCTANFVAIADQDDIWEFNKISLLLKNIGDNLLIYHDSAYINEAGISLGKSTSTHHNFVKGYCADNLFYFNCISGHTCLIRKELLALTPAFDAQFYYDWWLAYTAACTGKITFITNKLVWHRKHAESSTKNDKTDAKQLRLHHFNLFFEHPQTPSKLKALLKNLIAGYKQLETKKFSYQLLLLLLSNNKRLLFIRKRSFLSKFKFILRECSN